MKQSVQGKMMEIQTDIFNDNKPFNAYFTGDEMVVKQIIEEIYHEQYYKALNDHITGKNAVVLDIGAHVGLASLYFTLGKPSKIYAIEPNPANFVCLKENTKNFPSIQCENVAIGGVDSYRYLRSEKKDEIAESFYSTTGEGVKVSAITLKTFMEINKIEHIDAIKIDCEGSEYEIFLLDGFKDIASKIDFIVGESHNRPGIPPMIRDLLEPLGFKVEFLPFKNMTETYEIELNNGKKHSVTTMLKTIFTAKRV